MTTTQSSGFSTKSVTPEEQSTVASLFNTERFIPLQKGKKAPIAHETQPLQTITGNYGIKSGNGIMHLDVDDYKDGMSVPDKILSLRNDSTPLLTGLTPHGGTHFTYPVPEDAPRQIEEVTGKKNPTIGGCVEVKSHNQYVVGPGSELDGCDKEWCEDCFKPYEGHYPLTETNSQPQFDFQRFLSVVESLTEELPEEKSTTVQAGEINFSGEVEEWIDTARQNDTYLDELMEWSGSTNATPSDYDLRFGDRSRNEVALAEKLMWRFGSFNEGEQIVRQTLNQLHPPKWSQSGRTYRDSVINAAKTYTVDAGEFYELKSDRERSILRVHAECVVLEVAIMMEDVFTTTEVAQFQSFGYRQTLRVLNDLESAGYLTKTFVNRNECWKKVSEIPTTGPVYEMFVNQYQTVDEDRQQRHEYLLEEQQ